MANLTIRRRKTKQQRAMSAVSKAGTAALKVVKARIAWIAGKKAAKVAAPAVAVGTAAVVVKKRQSHKDQSSPETMAAAGVNGVPAGVA
jgi:hypothetical protein